MFQNVQSGFSDTPMKIEIISDIMDEIPENSTTYTAIKSTMAGKEPKVSPGTYSMFFIPGRIYNIWWHTGLDFKSLSLKIGTLTDDSEPGIIFKFNYTLNR